MSKSDEAKIGIDGVIEWRDEEGELHRVGGPAATYPNGRLVWFIEGEKVCEVRSARQPSQSHEVAVAELREPRDAL